MSAVLKTGRILTRCTKKAPLKLTAVQKRYFEAPQEKILITEIEPFLGTAQYWKDTVEQLKTTLAENASELDEYEETMLKHSLRVAEYMTEKQKEQLNYPYLARHEAGNEGQIASIYGNVGHKMGEELYYRVREGFDTEQEFYGENALYGPFGTEEDP
eukprot:UN33512